jgi:sulfonate transport system substrate-binding protein
VARRAVGAGGHGKFVDEHPEVVAQLLKRQQQAVQWLTDDRQQAGLY